MKTRIIVVLIFIVIQLSAAILYYAGVYVPEPPYCDVYYMPFILASGPFVCFASIKASAFVEGIPPFPLAPHVAIIIVPGLFNIVLGSLQWYLIVRFLQWVFGNKPSRHPEML